MGMNKDAVYSREELEAMITKMRIVSNDFYYPATKTGNHAFIEFCGLMNEYIEMCRYSMNQDIDFSQANVHTGITLKATDYQVQYFAEKFECIFGGIFSDPKNQEVFKKAMGWK